MFYIVNGKKCQSRLSRSAIRKIFSLINIQYIVPEGRSKVCKATRSLVQLICVDLINFHRNPQEIEKLQHDMYSAIHSNVCVFLGAGIIFLQSFFLSECNLY